MCPGARQNLDTPYRTGGRASRVSPGSGDPATSAGFCSEREFSDRHGLSYGAVVAGIQRGEIPVTRVGARVLVCEAAFDLRALGVSTPAQLGELCKGLGLKTAPELIAFLGSKPKCVGESKGERS
jgi:hypothetical protein